MDDFYRAGGLLAVLREVRELLDPTALTVTGRPLVDYLDAAPIWDPEVIRLRRQPLLTEGGIAVLRGNLAPAPSSNPQPPPAPHPAPRTRSGLRQHRRLPCAHRRSRARCGCEHRAGAARLRAQGLPGMPEVSNMPLPKKLLAQGVPRHGAHLRRPDERHCLRNCGAACRPRGRGRRTAGVVQTGDEITLDVPGRRHAGVGRGAARRRPNAATRRLRQPRTRLGAALHRPRPAGRHGRRPRLPCRRHRRSGSRNPSDSAAINSGLADKARLLAEA